MPSEQTRKRRQNQREILDFLRRSGSAQRSLVSSELNIRKSSVTSICQELLKVGALREIEPGAFRSPLALNPDRWSALAIDLQVGRAVLGLVDASGVITKRTEVPLESKAPDPIFQALTQTISTLLAEAPTPPCGIGMSFPGPIAPKTGTAISALNLEGWANVEIAAQLSSQFGLGVAVENDASSELLGNCWFKSWGSDLRDVLYVSIHEGIGCSQLIDGELSRGTRSAAGEIGCLKSGNEGRQCACGKTDCLQTYCNAPAIQSAINSGHSLGDALQPLTSKLATAVAISDPQAVIVAAEDQELTNQIQSVMAVQLREELTGLRQEDIPIHPGFTCPESALLGAGAAVLSRCFSTESLSLEEGSR